MLEVWAIWKSLEWGMWVKVKPDVNSFNAARDWASAMYHGKDCQEQADSYVAIVLSTGLDIRYSYNRGGFKNDPQIDSSLKLQLLLGDLYDPNMVDATK